MKNNTPKDKKELTHLQEWLIFLSLCGLAIVFFSFQKGQSPALSQYGMKDWQTVCEGEGRIYRLKSQNTYVSYGDHMAKSLNSRDLFFLDEKDQILYHTSFFDSSALDTDGVWRFKNKQKENPINRLLFDKTEKYPFLHKTMQVLFRGNWKRYKNRKPKQALYGDEEMFEIAKNFQSLLIKRKEKEPLNIPCQAL